MADAAPVHGEVCRAYYYATPFAAADSSALLTAIAAGGVRFDELIANAKRAQSRQTTTLKERGRPYELTVQGGKVVSFSGQITRRIGNTAYDFLEDAYDDGDVFGLLLTTGDKATAGVQCFAMNVKIHKWDIDEPDPGASTHDFEMSPTADSTWDPMTVVIAS